MTTKFGRTTPSQECMLSLAGIDDSRSPVDVELSDEERMSMMTSGRRFLQKMTGKDFGFDLANWRNFFITNDKNDEYGYKHPYAFKNVDKAVQKAILDANRKRIIDKREKRANELLNMLLKSPLIPLSDKLASDVPETGGVYRIVETNSGRKASIFIGQSKNIRSHLLGKKTKSILERISKEKGTVSYAIQFILLSEPERVWFTQYAIEKTPPLVGESAPS